MLGRHRGAVLTVGFAADGTTALSLGLDGALRVWDLRDGQPVRTTPLPLQGDWLSTHAAVSANGELALVAQEKPPTLRLLSGTTGEVLKDLSATAGRVGCVAMSPDGAVALSGGKDGVTRLWDLGEDVERYHIGPKDPVFHDEVRKVALTPDGRWALISGSGKAEERLWLVELQPGGPRLPGTYLGSHRFYPQAVALAADGRRALCARYEGPVDSWDLAGGSTRELKGATIPERSVRCLAFSADGRRAVSGGDDQIVRLWDVEEGKLIRELPGAESIILAVAISADGRRILTGELSGAVRVWDVSE